MTGEDLANYFATEFANQHIKMTLQVKSFLCKLNGKDLLECDMEEAQIPNIQKENIGKVISSSFFFFSFFFLFLFFFFLLHQLFFLFFSFLPLLPIALFDSSENGDLSSKQEDKEGDKNAPSSKQAGMESDTNDKNTPSPSTEGDKNTPPASTDTITSTQGWLPFLLILKMKIELTLFFKIEKKKFSKEFNQSELSDFLALQSIPEYAIKKIYDEEYSGRGFLQLQQEILLSWNFKQGTVANLCALIEEIKSSFFFIRNYDL